MLTQTTKSRLALRGIDARDDKAFRRMLPWSKLAFAVGGAQAFIATTTGNSDMLWSMVPVAALAVILPHHPIEYAYNYGIRFITRTLPLPANRAPVRFAFFMATVIIALTAMAFDAGYTWLGYLLGMQVVAVSATFCVTSFCIPAAIWALIRGDGAQVSTALNRPA